ncbi:MAG: archaellin/type IV pilin N-terminal domain-containing protein [Cuniculiplasma sp.]
MKQIRQKNDKAVSPIIATILLIAITVVLAATLVTILGGFTHGVSNTVETAGVTDKITSNQITISVQSSSSAIPRSSITITVTGAKLNNSKTSGILSSVDWNGSSSTFTGGSSYVVTISLPSGTTSTSGVSFELIYKGNVIYNSAS